MAKYARIVFEAEAEDSASEEEILDSLEAQLRDFISAPWGIDDVELHERPYIKDSSEKEKTKECNHDFYEVTTFVSDLTTSGKPQYDVLRQCVHCKALEAEPAGF